MSEEAETEDLARKRTELAEDRTIQATERTFAGWLRTAYAAIALGLGFHVFYGEFQPPYLARSISTLFIALGAGIALMAERRASSTFKHLSTHQVDGTPRLSIRWLSWTVILGATVLIVGLWVLQEGP